jgi:hypothetical protein
LQIFQRLHCLQTENKCFNFISIISWFRSSTQPALSAKHADTRCAVQVAPVIGPAHLAVDQENRKYDNIHTPTNAATDSSGHMDMYYLLEYAEGTLKERRSRLPLYDVKCFLFQVSVRHIVVLFEDCARLRAVQAIVVVSLLSHTLLSPRHRSFTR